MKLLLDNANNNNNNNSNKVLSIDSVNSVGLSPLFESMKRGRWVFLDNLLKQLTIDEKNIGKSDAGNMMALMSGGDGGISFSKVQLKEELSEQVQRMKYVYSNLSSVLFDRLFSYFRYLI